MKNIRNFCIIAHIDHGKSTLADRLLQATNTISDRDFQNQVLDDMDLERERGITIVSAATTAFWTPTAGLYKGVEYRFNIIDTPGHEDFTAEVERSLRVLDGGITVLDAEEGVQSQNGNSSIKHS